MVLSSMPLASGLSSVSTPIHGGPTSPPGSTTDPEENDCGKYISNTSSLQPNITCRYPNTGGTGSSTTGTGSATSTGVASQNTIQPPTTPPVKLQDTALMLCEKREATINTILGRMVTRGQNQVTLFSTIAQRVEAFVTSKNLTLSNYDQLVAAITADQAKVESDLSTMQASDTLDCTSSNPRAVITTFQTDLKQEITDMQSYKTDIMNLIKAVKTVAQPQSGTTGMSNGMNGTPKSGATN